MGQIRRKEGCLEDDQEAAARARDQRRCCQESAKGEEMTDTYEAPVICEDKSPAHETKETHPSYGMIGASRVTGKICLFGSDFVHHSYMTISISNADLFRGLSSDLPFAHDEIIEVALSEAQWATFVSTPNNGQGVQCTIQHIHRKGVPQIPNPPDRHDQFKNEIGSLSASGKKVLNELAGMIDALKISAKQKEELKWKLTQAARSVGSSAEFVADQFVEHMEKVTENAKIEVNSYITSTVHRAGLSALRGEIPIALTGPTKND